MTVRELIRALRAFDPDMPVEVFAPSRGFDSEPVEAVYQYSARFTIGGYHDHVVISAGEEGADD